jgi:hypothetical protein
MRLFLLRPSDLVISGPNECFQPRLFILELLDFGGENTRNVVCLC